MADGQAGNNSIKYNFLIMGIAARIFFLCLLLSCLTGPAVGQVYPYNTIRWEQLPSSVDSFMGKKGMFHGFVNSRLVVGGGYRPGTGKGGYDSVLFKADGYTGKPVRTFVLDQPVADAGAGNGEGMLVYAGGKNTTGLLRSVRVLTFSVDNKITAAVLPDLPEPVCRPAVLVSGKKIYVAGGRTSSGFSHQFLELDLDQKVNGWKTLTSFPSNLINPALFMQSDGEQISVYLAATSTDAVSNSLKGSMLKYDALKKIWVDQSADRFAALGDNASAVATGSTYALISCGSAGDSLYLFNTITKRVVYTDVLPAGETGGTQTVLKDGKDYRLLRSGVGGWQQWIGKSEDATFFSGWDYIVVISYLLLTVFIGLKYSGKHQSTTTYFKGDGKIPAWAVGISILGAQISAISFMSTPAKVYATNWNYFILSVGVILVIPVVNRYFIPFYRRLNITSAYEYLHKRFNYAMRFTASLLYILFELGRLAVILILPSLALTVVTGIDVNMCVLLMGLITLVYTFKGGIKAVIWTDVMQVFVLFGGSILCIVYILFFLPGKVPALSQLLVQQDKFNIIDTQLNLTTPNFWVVLVAGWTLSFLPYSTDQTTVQRYLTTKSEKDARRSVRVSAWISIPATVFFMGIGTLIYLFYYYHPQEVNINHGSQDSIFPWYIVSQLPPGIRGVLIAGIFAATMSSLSSSLTSASTAFITDFYTVAFAGKTQKSYLSAARLTTLVTGLLAIGIALFIIHKGVISLWDQYNIFVGLFTGGIGGIFCLGIFTTKGNATGAMGGLIIGGITQYIVSNYTHLHFLLYASVGLVVCLISGYLISLVAGGTPGALEGLTIYTQVNKADNAP